MPLGEILYYMKPMKFERETSNLIEDIEKEAWEDMYEAMPEDFAKDFEFDFIKLKNISLCSCKKIPFGHFNASLGLGYPNPAIEDELDFILEYYTQKRINSFYIHWSPNCAPADFEKTMAAKGLAEISGWDRIVRVPEIVKGKKNNKLDISIPLNKKYKIEEVTDKNSKEWSSFIDELYGLPTSPWLLNLVGREGWYHYMLKEGTKIIAVRTARIKDNTAWLGIDAPVPGIMVNDFEPDFVLSAKITEDCIKKGVEIISTVIEKHSAIQDTKAYYYWDKLGYKIAYYRKNYSIKK
ncbi:MAG: hypothetical protein JST55_00455 [Bacteroidetes bacterium]|nr:hypothetical protein [Bacteroidota bacterium]